MIDSAYGIISSNQTAASAIGFLIGVLVVHWLDIARTRRAELSRTAAPIAAALIGQLDNPPPDKAPCAVAIGRETLLALAPLLAKKEQEGYRQDVESYLACFMHTCFRCGLQTRFEWHVKDQASLRVAIERLLAYCKLR